MKRIIILIMIITVVLCSGAAAENAGDNPGFRTLTGLDELSRKLDSGITIRRVYYTDGFGFSTSEFTTTDETEIRSLWTALNQITVKGQVNESITDWYPQIVFYLSDETTAHVTFESHWLSLPVPWPQANYELENDDAFWNLTAALVNRCESSVHPKENAWTGSWDGRYGIGVQEASEDHIDVALYREDCYDRNEIENLMLAQDTRYKIPAGVERCADGVRIGNKTGELDSAENDAAVVYSPGGDYILCIFSADWDSKNEALTRIQDISETVYRYFNG
jgi:hypothetical protein